MDVIPNKWIQKHKKKAAPEKAPAFESIKIDSWRPTNINKPIKRHTNALHATMHKTLRGVRK